MRKFECPHCGETWTMSYLRWVLTAPFHWFSVKEMRDYRKTKCPYCGKKGWLKAKRIKK